MAWQRVASVADVDPDRGLSVNVAGKELAAYRVGDDVHALEVRPHAYALLSDGFVEGNTMECPLHQAIFHIPSGKCMAAPADSDLATFPVKIEGEDVLVDV